MMVEKRGEEPSWLDLASVHPHARLAESVRDYAGSYYAADDFQHEVDDVQPDAVVERS
jgi:hypothetical protein